MQFFVWMVVFLCICVYLLCHTPLLVSCWTQYLPIVCIFTNWEKREHVQLTKQEKSLDGTSTSSLPHVVCSHCPSILRPTVDPSDVLTLHKAETGRDELTTATLSGWMRILCNFALNGMLLVFLQSKPVTILEPQLCLK